MTTQKIQIMTIGIMADKSPMLYKVVDSFNGGVSGEGYTLKQAQARCHGAREIIVWDDAEWIEGDGYWYSEYQYALDNQIREIRKKGYAIGKKSAPYINTPYPEPPNPEWSYEWKEAWVEGWCRGHKKAIDDRCEEECRG